MSSAIRLIFTASFFIGIALCLIWFPWYALGAIIIGLTAVGFYDITQTKHTILRNYPVVGHLRFILEGIAPEIHQYFIENDLDGKPISRNQRSYIYQRAKLANRTHPFGTELDLQENHASWMRHSIYPAKRLAEFPTVTIGGKDCLKPYKASLMNISAMSYGALSANAVTALNKAAKHGGFYHNTGEGGISSYHLQGGDIVYQIGTGYFGCRDDEGNFSPDKFVNSAAHDEVKMIEIKISQGAKPGHGGVLPAAKNTEIIAAIRGVKPYTDVLSPPGHTAFSNPAGLMQFIKQLRELSGGKPVGFKLCIGSKQEFIDICKAMVETGIKPDFITVDGAEGGTGAAPIVFSDHVGMPWENALIFVADTLIKYDLKKDIRLITSSKIITGFDIMKALCMGADLCNSARGMMIALGCIQALECHNNRCPTGVTTHNPRLMKGLVVEEKWKRVVNYHDETLNDFLDIFAASGHAELSELNRSIIYKQLNYKENCFEDLYPTPGVRLN
jgi:glutamate synthase domain-containing protein 2